MSFWEDRFVDRPHASARPTDSPNEDTGSSSAPDAETGRAWSYVPEDSAPRNDASEQADAYEPDEVVAEEAAPATETQIEAWGESQHADENEHDDELPDELAASIEIDESPAVEYKRQGLFRRRKPVTAATAFEDEAAEEEAPQQEEPEHAEPGPSEPEFTPAPTEFVGNGHAWSYVPESNAAEDTASEPADTYQADEVVAEYAAPEIEAAHEHEHEHSADDDADRWAEAAAAIEAEEASAVRYERRGLFRRRKPVTAATAFEDEAAEEEEAPQEQSESSEPEFTPASTEFVGNGHAWSYVTDDDADGNDASEQADAFQADASDADEVVAEDAAPANETYGADEHEHDDELPDELAASIEIDESPAVEYKRQGLFRRRKPVTAATAFEDETHDGAHEEPSDGAVPIEDDAFENVPMYTALSAYTHTSDRPDSAPEDADEQLDEVDAFVVGEADNADTDPDTADEPELDREDDEAASEPETEFEAESAEEVELEVAVAEHEPEPEPEQPFDVPVTSLQDEPVVLRKRNGGGPARGKKVVGLKVGASQIAAAVVAGGGDRPALVDLARRPLEPGVVIDGELRDPEALARALKSFFKDHGLPLKNIRLGLSSSRVGVRTFDIAGIDDDDRFDNAVRFKAHEVLPVAAHESVLDYRVVEERYTESGEISRRVLLVVAPRDQVEPYIEACRSAGLRLAGLDLEAFGLLRAFVPPLGSRARSEDSATVVAAIGHEASTLLVAGGGVCEFTRVFDWGGGALQAAIAEELDVPLMEAATILTHLSLSGPGRHLDSLDSDTRSRALEAVRTRLTPFARELVSSLQFYQTQPESLGIREILITGGTSHLEGLGEALHQMIGVSVSVGDPLGRVAVETEIPVALDSVIGSLAVPIGLAIEDEAARSVNLLPKDARQTRARPNALAVALPVAVAVPLAALAFLFIGANGAARDSQAELDAVRAEIAKLPEPTRPNIDPALVGEQAQRATAVAQVLGGRLSWERVLGDISRVLPSGVSLTELAATTPQPTTPEAAPSTTEETSASSSTPAPAPAPVPAVPSTPTGVTVTGYAFDYASIARALARIQAVPSLTNAQLQSATPAVLGQKRVIEFTIVADLATSGGAQ